MPVPSEIVQVIKRESGALGGNPSNDFDYPAPIDPQEDVVEAAGYAINDATNRDLDALLWRDGSDMYFRDGNNPAGYTLTELASGVGGGITASQHKTLRQLIHFIDNGPAEGFASGAYREMTGTVFPTAIVWYDDATKVKKLVEKLLTYSGAFPTQIQWKMYGTDGTTVLATVTDAISYTGPFETSRTRTIV